MIYHQSNVFLQDLPNSFHHWFNFSILLYSGVSQQFTVVFLVVFLIIWRPKKSFTSLSYPFSQRFMVLVQGHPLIIFWSRKFFSFLQSPSFQKTYSFSAFSYHSPNLIGASFKHSLFSSWSLRSFVSKLSHVSSFICQFLPGDSSLYFVHLQFLWWFVQDSSYFVIISIHSWFWFHRCFIEGILKLALYLS